MRYLLMVLVLGFTLAALAPTFSAPASLFFAMTGGVVVGASSAMIAMSRYLRSFNEGGHP